jgi:hypothetical protein
MTHGINRCAVGAAIALLVLLYGPRIVPAWEDPGGWDQAQFGMTVEQLREAYPELQGSEPKEPAVVGEVRLNTARLWLENQQFGRLHPCKVDFRFVRGQLLEVTFSCPGSTPDEVRAVLEERYGPPGTVHEKGLVWTGSRTRISMHPRSGYFNFSDHKRGESLLQMLLQEAMKKRAPAKPPAGSESPEAPKPSDSTNGGAKTSP